MHPVVLDHYFGLFRKFPPGCDVLELGANELTARAFSAVLPSNCRYRGLNLKGPRSGDGWEIVGGNANAMPFDDASADAIICNAMLEHDKHFWLTLAEVRRVLRPGGLFFVGAPGYENRVTSAVKLGRRIDRRFRNGRARSAVMHPVVQGLMSTRTLAYHAPPDYYRFSPDAFRAVVLDRFDVLRLDKVSRPVRLVAVGRRN